MSIPFFFSSQYLSLTHSCLPFFFFLISISHFLSPHLSSYFFSPQISLTPTPVYFSLSFPLLSFPLYLTHLYLLFFFFFLKFKKKKKSQILSFSLYLTSTSFFFFFSYSFFHLSFPLSLTHIYLHVFLISVSLSPRFSFFSFFLFFSSHFPSFS